MARCIIAKLPQTWTNFATSLKYKRQEFDIADLIGSLDVEEKMRAKDVHGKKIIEGNSSAHVVQRKPSKFPQKEIQARTQTKRPLLLLRRIRRTRKKEIASLVANPGIMLGSAKRASGSPT